MGYRKDILGAKLEAVTSSAISRSGDRVTLAICDETHNWLPSNAGDRLAEVLRDGTLKMGGRVVELSNAPELGRSSVAEMTERDALEDPDVLFYARRGPVEPHQDLDEIEIPGPRLLAIPRLPVGAGRQDHAGGRQVRGIARKVAGRKAAVA